MDKLSIGGSSFNELRSQDLFGQYPLGQRRVTGHGVSAGRDHGERPDRQPRL